MIRDAIGMRLKGMRLKSGMTIQDLAQKSKVSSNMISRIERGLTVPSVEILVKLAGAFDRSISYFVEDARKDSGVIHTRGGGGEPLFFFEEKHQIVGLTQGLRDPSFSVFIDRLDPGCHSGDSNMVHSGDEFVYVIAGAVEFVVEDEVYLLKSGDSLGFKATLPHRWRNLSSEISEVLWTVSPPPSVVMGQRQQTDGGVAA